MTDTQPITPIAVGPPPERWRKEDDDEYHGLAIKFGNPKYECIIATTDINTLGKMFEMVSSLPFDESKIYPVRTGKDAARVKP